MYHDSRIVAYMILALKFSEFSYVEPIFFFNDTNELIYKTDSDFENKLEEDSRLSHTEGR